MSSSKENCQTDQHQTCPREAAAGPQGAQLEKYEFVKIKIGSRLVEESPVTKYEFVKLEHNGGGIALCNRPFLKIFCRQGSRRKILTKGMKTCSTDNNSVNSNDFLCTWAICSQLFINLLISSHQNLACENMIL